MATFDPIFSNQGRSREIALLRDRWGALFSNDRPLWLDWISLSMGEGASFLLTWRLENGSGRSDTAEFEAGPGRSFDLRVRENPEWYARFSTATEVTSSHVATVQSVLDDFAGAIGAVPPPRLRRTRKESADSSANAALNVHKLKTLWQSLPPTGAEVEDLGRHLCAMLNVRDESVARAYSRLLVTPAAVRHALRRRLFEAGANGSPDGTDATDTCGPSGSIDDERLWQLLQSYANIESVGCQETLNLDEHARRNLERVRNVLDLD
ncbi:hypothetical protein [Phycicoccus sp.]|uniref:hypothetical protein n=1 Tax=Phycicoccus sp. TaxID=1902410 RepID=UPI002C84652B|nr:hypothetical protein [Phycicoccus sp.]HMM95581.1 hypothetical protein [Phycicoccus sp.]